jgi:hypothetical protein
MGVKPDDSQSIGIDTGDITQATEAITGQDKGESTGAAGVFDFPGQQAIQLKGGTHLHGKPGFCVNSSNHSLVTFMFKYLDKIVFQKMAGGQSLANIFVAAIIWDLNYLNFHF